jgi:hypothetical protein
VEAKIDLVPERSVILNGRKVGVSGTPAFGLKSCNPAIPVSGARLRPADGWKGWIADTSQYSQSPANWDRATSWRKV